MADTSIEVKVMIAKAEIQEPPELKEDSKIHEDGKKFIKNVIQSTNDIENDEYGRLRNQ